MHDFDWLHLAMLLIVAVLVGKYLVCAGGYLLCWAVLKISARRIPNMPKYNSGPSSTGFRQQAIAMVSGYIRYKCQQVGNFYFLSVRLFFYKKVFCVRIGKGSIIYRGANIRQSSKLVIGDNSIVGSNAKLDARSGIFIGSRVNISDDVWIWTNQHDVQDKYFSVTGQPVKVLDYAWVSSRVTILPGVTVGEGSVIAAGAVVTGDTEPYGIYGGIPARKIGERTRNLDYYFDASKDYAPFY